MVHSLLSFLSNLFHCTLCKNNIFLCYFFVCKFKVTVKFPVKYLFITVFVRF